VRKVIQWTVVPVAIAAVACKGSPRTRTSMSDDLKRDLQLATATPNIRISPDEISPKSHEELALKPKKAPNGPKVIRTEHPTVKASVTPVKAAEIKSDIPQVTVMASAPAPSETPSTDAAPPLARPSPTPTISYPGAAAIPGDGSGGAGGVLGGIFGAVMRGGMGDDDHCDPRGAPRRPSTGVPIGGGAATFPGGIMVPRGPGGMRGRPRM